MVVQYRHIPVEEQMELLQEVTQDAKIIGMVILTEELSGAGPDHLKVTDRLIEWGNQNRKRKSDGSSRSICTEN
jgi:hypothetical protein